MLIPLNFWLLFHTSRKGVVTECGFGGTKWLMYHTWPFQSTMVSLVSFFAAFLSTICVWTVYAMRHSGSFLSCLSVLRNVAYTAFLLLGRELGSSIRGYFVSQ